MSPGAFQAGGAPAQREWFTTTHWSVVLKAADTASPAAKEALETLCRNYWYPLYAYVRRQGHGPEDAQDLTQEFFALLGKSHFAKCGWQQRTLPLVKGSARSPMS